MFLFETLEIKFLFRVNFISENAQRNLFFSIYSKCYDHLLRMCIHKNDNEKREKNYILHYNVKKYFIL